MSATITELSTTKAPKRKFTEEDYQKWKLICGEVLEDYDSQKNESGSTPKSSPETSKTTRIHCKIVKSTPDLLDVAKKILNVKRKENEEIGHGAYGTVFQINPETVKKEFKTKSIGTIREIDVSTKCKRKVGEKQNYLVQMLDFSFTENWITMESYSMSVSNFFDLFDQKMSNYSFSEDPLDLISKRSSFLKKSNFVFQILTAIAYLHSQNIIHRDIKPANILIRVDQKTGEIEFALGDFSIARPANSFKVIGKTIINALAPETGLEGTAVLSPEKELPKVDCDYNGGPYCGYLLHNQLEIDQKHFGYPVDYWSFGIVLLMASGIFANGNWILLIKSVMRKQEDLIQKYKKFFNERKDSDLLDVEKWILDQITHANVKTDSLAFNFKSYWTENQKEYPELIEFMETLTHYDPKKRTELTFKLFESLDIVLPKTSDMLYKSHADKCQNLFKNASFETETETIFQFYRFCNLGGTIELSWFLAKWLTDCYEGGAEFAKHEKEVQQILEKLRINFKYI